MGIILILPILVSGFMYCHLHPYYYFKLHRFEGQYLYLQAAKQGLYILILAFAFNWILLWLLSFPTTSWNVYLGPDYIHSISSAISSLNVIDKDKSLEASWLLVLSITMLVAPITYTNVFKYFFMKKHGLKNQGEIDLMIMGTLFSDSPLDDMLFKSLTNKHKSIMLSMDDRKVYVGKVASMGEPNENKGANQEISFVPFVSGYRNAENLKVTFTTNYKDFENVDFFVILKQEKIVSATLFDFEIYNKFQQA